MRDEKTDLSGEDKKIIRLGKSEGGKKGIVFKKKRNSEEENMRMKLGNNIQRSNILRIKVYSRKGHNKDQELIDILKEKLCSFGTIYFISLHQFLSKG